MPYIVKDAHSVMGTFVTITVVHPHPDEARKAICAAFDEIYRINDLMSVHKETSEISLLNKTGCYKGVSAATKYVIERANHFSQLSNGAFDITILPILKLWGKSARTGKLPTDAEINEASELVNYRNIAIEGNNISFRKAGMSITLAGIAKGYAVDKAIETLSRGKIRHALVNAGGDIRAIGGKTEDIPWKIAIRDPKNRKRSSNTVELREEAIATSGTYQRSFNDIINPEAGRPVQGMLSSTIIAGKAIDADILATSMFILGAERGTELFNRMDGIKSLVITGNRSLL